MWAACGEPPGPGQRHVRSLAQNWALLCKNKTTVVCSQLINGGEKNDNDDDEEDDDDDKGQANWLELLAKLW